VHYTILPLYAHVFHTGVRSLPRGARYNANLVPVPPDHVAALGHLDDLTDGRGRPLADDDPTRHWHRIIHIVRHHDHSGFGRDHDLEQLALRMRPCQCID